MAEDKGLTFAPVEASAEKLGDAVQMVNSLVAEKAGHPIYFFANDARGGRSFWIASQ